MCREVFVIAALLTYLFQHTEASCANSLGPCIANECPNKSDAGQDYVCIQDTCCPPTSGCNDGAVNCQMFTQECFTSMYRVCMMQHCRRTCGLCPATGGGSSNGGSSSGAFAFG
uniref:ShKT domain-containing protein n=1 Tax=Bursaphelenchus xylophilus TaxID=6326 RepID=A0A1I7RXF1_BURXY